jgi:hypothetical protein
MDASGKQMKNALRALFAFAFSFALSSKQRRGLKHLPDQVMD